MESDKKEGLSEEKLTEKFDTMYREPSPAQKIADGIFSEFAKVEGTVSDLIDAQNRTAEFFVALYQLLLDKKVITQEEMTKAIESANRQLFEKRAGEGVLGEEVKE